MASQQEIIYFLPYSNGGVTSFVRNLLEFRPKSTIHYKVIQYREKDLNTLDVESSFNADEHIIFNYSSKENLYAVFKRLKKHINSEESYIVANDGLELRLVAALKLPNPLIYIVHGDFDYYYQLVKQNAPVIDQIVTISEYLYNKFITGLTNNQRIVKAYFPVKNIVQPIVKTGILKLVFVGFVVEQKGVLLFADIYQRLVEKKINFEFNIIGAGDKTDQLKTDFKNSKQINLLGQLNNNEVITILCASDIFLFPTYTEGMPVSVIEAMKCGCIPIVSDIPSGIPELVINENTGYKIQVGDTEGFANAIAHLAENPGLRKQLSQNARAHANAIFDAYKQAKAYENLILSTKTQNKKFPKYNMGKLLNKPFLPNVLVKAIRQFVKHPKI